MIVNSLLDRFLSFFSHDLAIDMGSANIRIFVKDKGLAVNEPMICVVNKTSGRMIATGEVARKMIGRIPPHVKIVRPIVRGAVVDFDASVEIIKKHIQRLHLSYGLVPKIPKPKVLLSISSDVSGVEKKAMIDVILAAGARRVILVSKLQAAGSGAGFNFSSKKGVLVVDFGASMTEIGIVSENGLIFSKRIYVGGGNLSQDIINFIRLKYGVLIGESQAEEIKISVCRLPNSSEKLNERYVIARGRDLESSLPRSIKVSSSEISETVMSSVNLVVKSIKEIVEKSPPEFLSDIADMGIILVGGASQIGGIPQVIMDSIKTSVWVAESPSFSVVTGMSRALTDENILKMIKIREFDE